MKGNIKQCFADLIKKRGWYKGASDARSACADKKLFLADKLPYEKMKRYLLNAGANIIQEEIFEYNAQKNTNSNILDDFIVKASSVEEVYNMLAEGKIKVTPSDDHYKKTRIEVSGKAPAFRIQHISE